MRIAPMVINMLNMRQHMNLQEESFGGYSEQIADYTEKGLQNQHDTAAGGGLRSIVDPYSYRGQLPQPKLVILGTNDRYWPVDAVNLYWDASGRREVHSVRAEQRARYPRLSARVGLGVGSAPACRREKAVAQARLEFHRPGRLVAAAIIVRHQTAIRHGMDGEPQRLAISGKSQWNSQPAQSDEAKDGRFVVDLKKPADGFAAVFAEAQFNGRAMPFYLSTDLRVAKPAKTAAATSGGN